MPFTEIMKLLIAACHLEERGELPFTPESLTMEVWRRFPSDFGLKGGWETKHPDSHKVWGMLSGKRGLVTRKLIAFDKKAERGYILTREGREIAQDAASDQGLPLGKPTPPPTPISNGLSDEVNKFLDRVLNCKAMYDFLQKLQDETTFPDSLVFWGIPKEMRGDKLGADIAMFTMMHEKVVQIMTATTGEIVMLSGRSIGWKEMEHIAELDKYLLHRFQKLLGVLQARK